MPYVRTWWPSHDELARLVRAVRSEEPHSLDGLLEAVRPSLLTFFARRFPAAVAEDLAQIALVRIARAANRIDAERADRYLVTVARNIARTEYNRRSREVQRYVPLELAADVESPDRVDARLEHEELVRAVGRVSREVLPPPLRDIVLELLRGLTPTEIAERRHENPVTVRTRMMRARAQLRLELRAYLEPPRSHEGVRAGVSGPDAPRA